MPTLKPGVVEYLEINNYPLHNYANWLSSMTGMRKVAYKIEAESAPYTNGTISYPTWLDGLTVVFPGLMIGEVDSDGVATGDARAGLETNYEEFYAAVLAPVSTGDGTRAVEWHKASGATWTGVVRVGNFDVRDQDPGAMAYSLTLEFRAGRLTAP